MSAARQQELVASALEARAETTTVDFRFSPRENG